MRMGEGVRQPEEVSSGSDDENVASMAEKAMQPFGGAGMPERELNEKLESPLGADALTLLEYLSVAITDIDGGTPAAAAVAAGGTVIAVTDVVRLCSRQWLTDTCMLVLTEALAARQKRRELTLRGFGHTPGMVLGQDTPRAMLPEFARQLTMFSTTSSGGIDSTRIINRLRRRERREGGKHRWVVFTARVLLHGATGHWITVEVRPSPPEIRIYDSGSRRARYGVLENRIHTLFSAMHATQYHVRYVATPQQEDSYNCGPLALQALETVLEGGRVEHQTNAQSNRNRRIRALLLLVHNARAVHLDANIAAGAAQTGRASTIRHGLRGQRAEGTRRRCGHARTGSRERRRRQGCECGQRLRRQGRRRQQRGRERRRRG